MDELLEVDVAAGVQIQHSKEALTDNAWQLGVLEVTKETLDYHPCIPHYKEGKKDPSDRSMQSHCLVRASSTIQSSDLD